MNFDLQLSWHSHQPWMRTTQSTTAHNTLCDFSISIQHKFHQNGKHFGVSRAIRDWICENPSFILIKQCIDLFTPIAKYKIQGIQPNCYFTNTQIDYYWYKGIASAQYLSQALWKNIEYIICNTEVVSFANHNN